MNQKTRVPLAIPAICILAGALLQAQAEGPMKKRPKVLDRPVIEIGALEAERGYDTDGDQILSLTTTTKQRGKAFRGAMTIYLHVKGKSGTDYYAVRTAKQSVYTWDEQKLEARTRWRFDVKPRNTPEPVTLRDYVIEYSEQVGDDLVLLKTRRKTGKADPEWKVGLVEQEIQNQLAISIRIGGGD